MWWVFDIAVEELWPTLLCRIVLIWPALSSGWKFGPVKNTVLLEASAVKLILLFSESVTELLLLHTYPIYSIGFPAGCRIQKGQSLDMENPDSLQEILKDSPGRTNTLSDTLLNEAHDVGGGSALWSLQLWAFIMPVCSCFDENVGDLHQCKRVSNLGQITFNLFFPQLNKLLMMSSI